MDKVSYELTHRGGKPSHEVANYIESVIEASLSYECYLALVGNNGLSREENNQMGRNLVEYANIPNLVTMLLLIKVWKISFILPKKDINFLINIFYDFPYAYFFSK